MLGILTVKYLFHFYEMGANDMDKSLFDLSGRTALITGQVIAIDGGGSL